MGHVAAEITLGDKAITLPASRTAPRTFFDARFCVLSVLSLLETRIFLPSCDLPQFTAATRDSASA